MVRGKISRRDTGRPLAVYTPTAVASLDITSVITSLYPKYRISIERLIPASNDVELYIRFDTANGASFDTDATYRFAQTGLRSTTATALLYQGNAVDSIRIGEDQANLSIGSGAAEGISGEIMIEHVGSVSVYPLLTWRFNYVISDVVFVNSGAGGKATAAVHNAVQLFFEAGNIASGIVRVYGIPAL